MNGRVEYGLERFRRCGSSGIVWLGRVVGGFWEVEESGGYIGEVDRLEFLGRWGIID